MRKDTIIWKMPSSTKLDMSKDGDAEIANTKAVAKLLYKCLIENIGI